MAFTIVLRGYFRTDVDEALAQAETALASGDETLRSAARETLARAEFAVALRGYDRDEVDRAIEALLTKLT